VECNGIVRHVGLVGEVFDAFLDWGGVSDVYDDGHVECDGFATFGGGFAVCDGGEVHLAAGGGYAECDVSFGSDVADCKIEGCMTTSTPGGGPGA